MASLAAAGLAFDWIPKNTRTLLDGGCAWGYGTRFFKEKSKIAYGIEIKGKNIRVAKKRYPEINFLNCGLEKTPFKSNFFDVIILNDVLEHVKNELISLDEMFRILKSGGTLIITTPHKGLFAFMDPLAFVLSQKKKETALYRLLYRIKNGKYPPEDCSKCKEEHRHYSIGNLVSLLNKSKFNENYEIEKIFRSGLFIGVFTDDLVFFLSVINKKWASFLLKPLSFLSEIDFWIPYNGFSNNIAIKIKKN